MVIILDFKERIRLQFSSPIILPLKHVFFNVFICVFLWIQERSKIRTRNTPCTREIKESFYHCSWEFLSVRVCAYELMILFSFLLHYPPPIVSFSFFFLIHLSSCNAQFRAYNWGYIIIQHWHQYKNCSAKCTMICDLLFDKDSLNVVLQSAGVKKHSKRKCNKHNPELSVSFSILYFYQRVSFSLRVSFFSSF